MDMLTSLLPMFILLGIVVFASDRQEKRKVELEKVKAKAEWDRASESFRDDVTQEELEEIEAMEQEEEDNSWINDDDIDFDEYDEYYEQEN